jgi:tetratricopeptide (TPR) repeat protein
MPFTPANFESCELAQQAIHQAQAVQTTAPNEAMIAEAEAHLVAGRANLRLADSTSARRHLEIGLNLAQAAQRLAETQPASAQILEAHILRNLGIVAAETGDYIAARPYFESALERHRALGDHGESMALNNLALVANNLSDFTGARRYGDQALAIRREIGDARGEAVTTNNIALTLIDLGNYDEANSYMERALALYRQVSDRDGENGALINLGLVALLQGCFSPARAYLDQRWRSPINRRFDGRCLALADFALLFNLKDNARPLAWSGGAAYRSERLG